MNKNNTCSQVSPAVEISSRSVPPRSPHHRLKGRLDPLGARSEVSTLKSVSSRSPHAPRCRSALRPLHPSSSEKGTLNAESSSAAPITPLPGGLSVRPLLPKNAKRPAAARDPSPVPSDDSQASESKGKAGRTPICCLDCFDPSNTRNVHLHPDCWNLWHGLCGSCA